MSSLDRYPCLEISNNKRILEFISTGPKGDIKKIIKFQKTPIRNLYNLVFGNLLPDGSIDDSTISDNKDRDKILATVVSAIIDFTQQFPDSHIIFSGSTKERTRLYRMVITVNFELLSSIFEIWGLDEDYISEPFDRGKNYSGFLIHRNKS